MRVVSLLPSATEIVAALGGFEQLVGVTHCCDHPAPVTTLPRVTRTSVDADAAPGTVDAQVRAITAEGAPLYTLDEERIRALRPDLILTQALCEVCAVMETDVRALAARLEPVPQVLTLSATSLDGVFGDIAAVGAALRLSDEASEWEAGARMRMRRVHETLKAAKAPRPRVAVIEWGDPLYAAGHWVPGWWGAPAAGTCSPYPANTRWSPHSMRCAPPTRRSCSLRPAATTSRAPPTKRNDCWPCRVGSGCRAAACSRSMPMPSPRAPGRGSWMALR